jgi:hypothetical protein
MVREHRHGCRFRSDRANAGHKSLLFRLSGFMLEWSSDDSFPAGSLRHQGSRLCVYPVVGCSGRAVSLDWLALSVSSVIEVTPRYGDGFVD